MKQQIFKVLLVDDSLEELRVLVDILKRSNYQLIMCRNGRDALSRATLLNPDIILLDVRMPYMDGFAVIRLLKADPITSHIPVVFLSAANELQDRIEGLRLGAVDYIVKPASEEEVLLRVGIHLRDMPTSVAELKSEGVERNLTPEEVLIGAVCKILEMNYSEDMSIDELARLVGCPRHRLSYIFKSKFGCTVFSWWREQKMQRAQFLLLNSEVSIQNIADELGFRSPANFSTSFKDRFGVSPTEFRSVSTESNFGQLRDGATS